MRKLFLILILLVTASGCAAAPPEHSETPRVSKTPAPPSASYVPEPDVSESAPDTPQQTEMPVTAAQAVRLYEWFLDGRICGYVGDYQYWITRELDFGSDDPRGLFYVRDLTGDGVPEMYGDLTGVHYIWGVKNGQVAALETLVAYDTVLANGGIFYHRAGVAPEHDAYSYKGFSPKSREIPDLSFTVYHTDAQGRPRKTYILGYEEVTADEWYAAANVYFALRDETPDSLVLLAEHGI